MRASVLQNLTRVSAASTPQCFVHVQLPRLTGLFRVHAHLVIIEFVVVVVTAPAVLATHIGILGVM
jgi:hypothetical protein